MSKSSVYHTVSQVHQSAEDTDIVKEVGEAVERDFACDYHGGVPHRKPQLISKHLEDDHAGKDFGSGQLLFHQDGLAELAG